MEYNDREKQALALMKRADFKNISKEDVISITSKLSELRPEVARDIVAQFPEVASLIKSSWGDYRDLMANIIESDDNSIDHFYSAASNAQSEDADSRRQFYSLAEKVQADYSKCLDKPNLSAEEQQAICDRQLEVLKLVSEKDSEIRIHEEKIVDRVDKKDTEKREHNKEMIRIASAALVFGLSIGASVIGGNVKIPKIKL